MLISMLEEYGKNDSEKIEIFYETSTDTVLYIAHIYDGYLRIYDNLFAWRNDTPDELMILEQYNKDETYERLNKEYYPYE